MSNGINAAYATDETNGNPSITKSSSVNSSAARPSNIKNYVEQTSDGPTSHFQSPSISPGGEITDASSNGSFNSFAGNNYNSNGTENEELGNSYERRSEAGSENDWKPEDRSAFRDNVNSPRTEMSEENSSDKIKLSRYIELCGEYEAKLCGLEFEKQDLIHEKKRLHDALSEKDIKINDLDSKTLEVQTLKQSISELESKLKSLNSEKDALNKKVEDMEAAEASWTKEKIAADEEMNALQKVKLDSEGKVLELEEKIMALVQEKADIQEEKLRVEEELNGSYEKLDTLSLDLNALRSELEASKTAETSAIVKLTEREEKVKQLQTEVEEMKVANANFQKDLAAAVKVEFTGGDELEIVETKVKEMQKAMEEKEEREAQLIKELNTVKDELKETTSLHIRSVARVNEANGHIDALKVKLLEAELGSKKKSIEKKLKEEEEMKNALIQSNAELQSKLDESAEKIKTLTEEGGLKDNALVELKKKMAETVMEAEESSSLLSESDGAAVKKLAMVEKSLADLLEEKEVLEKKVKDCESMNGKLKRDLSKMEDDNKAFFHKLSSVNHVLKLANEEIDNLKTENEKLVLKSRDMDATVLEAVAEKERLALETSEKDEKFKAKGWSNWTVGGLVATTAVAAVVITRMKSSSNGGSA